MNNENFPFTDVHDMMFLKGLLTCVKKDQKESIPFPHLAISQSRNLAISQSRNLAISQSRNLAISLSRNLAISQSRNLAISLSRYLAILLSCYLAISLSCYLKKARSRNNGQNLSKDANLEEIWFATKLTLSVIPGAKLNGLITSFDQFIISSTGHLYLTGDYPW